MKLTRPTPITFERADGSTILVPPPRRRQMRAVYGLDTDTPDTVAAAAERRGRQIAILLEHATCSDAAGAAQEVGAALGELTPEEEIDILNALVCAHHGLDPANAVELQQALRSLVKKKALAARSGR